MAQEILHGHFSAFYWGQNYGGLEPYVVAAVFAVFGQSTFTLEITPALLDARCAFLLWRLGRRLFSPAIGISAALVFWIWPEVYVRASTIRARLPFLRARVWSRDVALLRCVSATVPSAARGAARSNGHCSACSRDSASGPHRRSPTTCGWRSPMSLGNDASTASRSVCATVVGLVRRQRADQCSTVVVRQR